MSEALNQLGKSHFLYNNYLARDLYLQMVLTVRKPNNDFDYSDKSLAKADSLLKQALTYEPDMPYVFSALGNINMALGNFEQSMNYYKKGYELMPNSPAFVNMMATILESYGSIEQILPDLRRFSNDPSANGNLAKYYTLKKEPKKAKNYLEQALKGFEKKFKDKESKEYFFSLMMLYNNCGDKTNAKIYADKCYKFDSTSVEALMAQMLYLLNPNNLDLIKSYIIKLVKYHPEFGMGRAFNAMLLSQNNAKLAIEEAKISLKTAPNNYFGLLVLALAYNDTDSTEKSYEVAKKMTKFYPKSYNSWSSLGSSSSDLKKNEEALQAYLMADSLNPKVANNLSTIGSIYNKLKNYTKAASYYRHSLFLDPKQAYCHSNLAFIYWQSLNKLDSAIYFFEKEIENFPKNIKPYLMIGSIYQKRADGNKIENQKRALEYYFITRKKAIESNNKGALEDANFYISNFYIQIGEFEKAIPFTEQLSKSQPLNLNYLYKVFFAYFRANQFRKADSLINFLQKSIPNIPEATKLAQFGNVKYRIKKYTDAEKYYKASLTIAKDTNSLVGSSLVLVRLNKFNEADELLKNILGKTPNDLITNLNYGFSLTMQKRYNEAKVFFEFAEKLEPKDNIIYFRWSSFYASQMKEKEAIEQLRKAFDLGFKDLWRLDDEEFETLRQSQEFKGLISKYMADKK